MVFSASKPLLAQFTNRAIIYSQRGDTSKVLNVLSYPALPPPPSQTVNIKFLLAPLNPADLNVIEGTYPVGPAPNNNLASTGIGSSNEPIFIGGNEGVAQVMEVGAGVRSLQKNDWVVMAKPQSGTWCTAKNVGLHDVLKIPKLNGLGEVGAATMMVNPPSAYNMLQNYVQLTEGDWVIQNGANSSVGQAVIQIAASKGLKTVNFVRPRENLDALVGQLQELGATKVLTYDSLNDKSIREELPTWTGGKEIKLLLNCVGGQETLLMAKLLGNNAHIVTYGAMAKQPLSIPTPLFIFKNLTAHGFWQSQWYHENSREAHERQIGIIVDLIVQGKLKEPLHEIITFHSQASDDDIRRQVMSAIAGARQGRRGKKTLFKFTS